MKTNEASLHFRRCHICGAVSETENALVDKCGHCGKFFAPFVFFDEKAALGMDAAEKQDSAKDDMPSVMSNRLKSNEWHQRIKSQYPPLWGFTVYW